jgi:prevent-host-death family protein
MDSVTASELSRQTAKVLDRVKASESVEITQHGQPVAQILPVVPMTGAPLLDRLIAEGRAIPAVSSGPIPPTPPRGAGEGGSLSKVLTEMRDDERY